MTQRDGTDEAADSGGRTRRGFLAAAGAAGGLALAGCLGGGGENGAGAAGSMTIFHAGSLAPPFSEAEPKFESENDVEVSREAQGSVASTQKITQQNRTADVLGVSDFRLIRDRILGDYGEWFVVFTTNAMSIQYREDSPGADDIGTDNWWEVLTRDDVTIGHSDPAADPGGYRAVMAQQLGAESYEGSSLYGQDTYQALRDNSRIVTDTETGLTGQLASGELDYAIYYQSLAQSADMPYVDLQPQVDLSQATPAYAEHYAKAEVETDSGTFVGAPIAYGMTVPSNARAATRGAQWVEYMTTEPGKEILRNVGLQPLETPVVNANGEGAVPDAVMSNAEARASLGPVSFEPQ